MMRETVFWSAPQGTLPKAVAVPSMEMDIFMLLSKGSKV